MNFLLFYVKCNMTKKYFNFLTLYFAKWHLWNSDFESMYLSIKIKKNW